MKKWLFITIAILVLGLILSYNYTSSIRKKYDIAMENIKSYDQELSNEKFKSVGYKLTIDQLEYFRDSILNELNKTRKELKIKDKNLQSMQYVASEFTKNDTIILRDTIFRNPELKIDTVIGDKWYNLQLGLKYPATITATPSFTSEKHIIVSSKKETVNPPKKFFLWRLFQKKHTVLNIDVIEKNPYIKNNNSKYIEVLK